LFFPGGFVGKAFDAKDGKCVGTVVCKMGEHRGSFRGYIAMLVVLKPYRGRGIGESIQIS
jgi:peptide alpha-N-acetyltransferase